MKASIGEVATSAHDGITHGVVVGQGTNADEAVSTLKARAEALALPVVKKRVDALLPYQHRSKEAGHWNVDFGIYDARFMVTPAGEWVVYGTLTELGNVSLKTPPRRGYR